MLWYRPSPRRSVPSKPWPPFAIRWLRPIKKFFGCQCKGAMMNEAATFDILRSGLWIAVQISTPMLAMALVAGVAVGLFQALTSIQEATLVFVPPPLVKLLAAISPVMVVAHRVARLPPAVTLPVMLPPTVASSSAVRLPVMLLLLLPRVRSSLALRSPVRLR